MRIAPQYTTPRYSLSTCLEAAFHCGLIAPRARVNMGPVGAGKMAAPRFYAGRKVRTPQGGALGNPQSR